MRQVNAGGGFPAIFYTWRKAREAGGVRSLYKALRSKNACKTCALGMGGQLGGMVNEKGHFPEVCKKSIQAMTADMQGAVLPNFFTRFDLEQLRAFTPRELEAAGRLTQPLYAGPIDLRYRVISWDEAMLRIGSRMKATDPREAFFYTSGRSSNEAGFLLQLLARIYGTNNVNNCSFYCHQASGVGLASVTGSGTATVELGDLEGLGKDDVVFLIGANPASNHPRLMTSLTHLKRRGGRIVVVNPLRETGLVRFRVPSDVRSLFFGSRIADEYVQPHIGGDIAFLSGVTKRVIELGAVDEGFVTNNTEGFDEFRQSLEMLNWDEIIERSGVSWETIDRIATLYAAATNAVFCWAMGITHHEHGVHNVQAIANLAMTRGMLGRPNRGLLPLRGHSNVQGIGSMAVTPKVKDAVFHALEAEFGVTLPTEPGLDTMACVVRASEGGVRFGLCLGGNLYGSNPDAEFATRAMGSIDMVVYLSTTLNTGHAWGRGKETIILPVLARDEEPQPTTQESMFNYVRLSDGGPARHRGPRAEVAVIADIGKKVTDNEVLDWDSMRRYGRIREAIAKVIPGYRAIGQIEETKQEFQIEGRTFHEGAFPTESGRARFHVVDLPQLAGGNGHLRLMTVRSEGQFNTVVYEDYDLYRGQDRRDVIMMSPVDMERLGLSVDQQVTVVSDTGRMHGLLTRPIDIRPGNTVMYYPEANALVPRTVDPASKTPAFKGTLITVEVPSP
ncbi:MAG TPA: FdhF/YdeP family oxidoreductase [Acidimicrobiia bacterium]|nr:FdhF/YdeP family oxidoreductase [Acidimicrobiia bacterium]